MSLKDINNSIKLLRKVLSLRVTDRDDEKALKHVIEKLRIKAIDQHNKNTKAG